MLGGNNSTCFTFTGHNGSLFQVPFKNTCMEPFSSCWCVAEIHTKDHPSSEDLFLLAVLYVDLF